MATVTISLSIEVHEPDQLTEYAKKRYEACWGEKDWEPADLGEAVYEALIASNENPAPLDYGIEIVNSVCADWTNPIGTAADKPANGRS